MGDETRFYTEYDGDGSAWLVALMQPGDEIFDDITDEGRVKKEDESTYYSLPSTSNARWRITSSSQQLSGVSATKNIIPDDYGIEVRKMVDGVTTLVPYDSYITEGIRILKNVSDKIIQVRKRLTTLFSNNSGVGIYTSIPYSGYTTLDAVDNPRVTKYLSLFSD